MSHFKYLLGPIVLLILAMRVEGQEVPLTTGSVAHYAVTMSVEVSTQTAVSGTTTVQTAPMTNASILKALVASGSAGSLKESDMDIVMNTSNIEVDVIAKTTHEVIMNLGQAGGKYGGLSDTIDETKTKSTVTVAATGYTVSLPGLTLPQNTNIFTHVTVVKSGGEAAVIFLSFVGGETLGNGSHFVQGTIRKANKVYYY